MTSLIERRRFLQTAALAGGTAVAMPSLLAEQVSAAAGSSDTILVTLTLAGGNDGLNTLGPFNDGTYRSLRGSFAISPSSAHPAEGGLLFHPNLRRLATRYRRGDVAVVQGVGDPGLDHSHFSNMARWQSGRPNGQIARTGWLGRWLDNAGLGPFGGLAIGGSGVPLHLRGEQATVTDLPHHGGALFGSDRSELRDRIMYRTIRRIGRGTDLGPWVDRVAEVNAQAVDSAQAVAPAYNRELPEGDLLPDMVLAARLINLNLGTRVLNVWHHGYDTHDDQIGASSAVGDHADLLDELDASLDGFFTELDPASAHKVVVMVYSEFGRRVEPNGSRGTDHGTSSIVMLIGRRVKGGLYGGRPSLRALDDRGDLRVTTDFRRVYSTVLSDWLEGDDRAVLGGNYRSLDIFSPGAVQLDPADLRGRANQIRSRARADPTDYLRHHSPRF